MKEVIVEVMKCVFRRFLEENGPNAEEKLQREIFGIRMVVSSGYGDFGIASIVHNLSNIIGQVTSFLHFRLLTLHQQFRLIAGSQGLRCKDSERCQE